MCASQALSIKAIVGLGNPGRQYRFNRHNIGFLVLDALCERYGGAWQVRDHMESADIRIGDNRVILVKPQTFMNDSGKVVPFLRKQGIGVENVLVVHDELEKPFGKLAIKIGGSARGHNGLRSIIGQYGQDFARLRFGISRPDNKEDVGRYVLQNFSEPSADLEHHIEQAVVMIEDLFNHAE